MKYDSKTNDDVNIKLLNNNNNSFFPFPVIYQLFSARNIPDMYFVLLTINPSFSLACGGDGTVGWILSVMDSMKSSFPRGRRPAIGIIPLGTGNDLSRSLNWGGKYRDKPLRKVLIDIAKADAINMDR